ncbi:MAG: right-handed parallel beta-helix repeat-containing protein [Rivularia sp. (in: cyanobacteria)]
MNDFDIPLNNESPLTASPQELVPSSALDGKDLVSQGSLSSSNSSMLPTLEEDILRYEMEDLKLSNYQIESNDASSGGKHISLLGSDGNTGTATGVFNGEAGTYEVNVGFYDENDGVSAADITVAGDTQSFSFDEDLPGNAAVAKALTSRTTMEEIELQPGDAFEIKGKANSGEFARFDYVDFVPTDSPTDTDGEMKSPTPISGVEPDTDGEMKSPTPISDTHTDGEVKSPTPIGDTDADGEVKSPTSTIGDTDTDGEVKSPTSTIGDTDTDGEVKSPTPISGVEPDTDGEVKSPTPISGVEPDTGGEVKSPTSTIGDTDADTFYVSQKGSDDNPGTKEQPWKTIDYAVGKDSVVEAGDTILVQPGTYKELITLEKSGNEKLGHITLKADGDVTLRDPDPKEGGFREGVIQSANQGHWIIDGFRIENTSWAGISLRDANNMIVQNNHTFETGASGIIVLPESYYKGGEAEVTSKNIKVLDNKIERANWRWTGRGDENGTQEALSIWGVDGFEVANNIVKEATREGIDIKTGSRNGSVHNNTVTGAAKISGTAKGYNGGPAIYVDGNRADTFNVDIYNNVVYKNASEGIAINDEEPGAGDVKDIRVFNNLVYDNGTKGVNSGAGIMVGSNVEDVEITNNTLSGNVQSFTIDGSDFFEGNIIDNVVLRNNIFANPSYRNGFIEDAKDVILDNNLFTDSVDKMFEEGSGVENIKETNNLQVKSVGFSDSKANDYHLNSDSPAVDTGTNTIPSYLSTDKDGKQRKIGKAVDIGTFEYGTSSGSQSTPINTGTSKKSDDKMKNTVDKDSSDEEEIVLRNRFF